jgi:hypothetical protein
VAAVAEFPGAAAAAAVAAPPAAPTPTLAVRFRFRTISVEGEDIIAEAWGWSALFPLPGLSQLRAGRRDRTGDYSDAGWPLEERLSVELVDGCDG